LRAAEDGSLSRAAELERQVRRMLADPRSHELVKNFAGQWLELRTLDSSTPEGTTYPDFDDNLRQAFVPRRKCFSKASYARTAA